VTNALPVIEQFTINHGALWTVSSTVTLTSRVNGLPTEYQVSENSSFSGAQWHPYKNALTYLLANTGYGERTIYFKVRNAEAESEASFAQITYSADSNKDSIPDSMDADSDGLPDSWELLHNLQPANAADATFDADGDGLTNQEVFALGSNPNKVDSDGDQLTDQEETLAGTSPIAKDTDFDGLEDNIDAAPTRSLQIASDGNFNLVSWYIAVSGDELLQNNELLLDNVSNGLMSLYFNPEMQKILYLENSIEILKIMVGLDPTDVINTNIDVDHDGKIGLPEIIDSLQNARGQ
jgi:hypothetical protein